MTIYLEDETQFFSNHKELYIKVEQVINECLQIEKVPYEGEVSLTVVDLETIHEINQTHRGVDRPTDVLSFPQIEPASVGSIEWDLIEDIGSINYDTGELILGDIILCDEKAKEQALSYGHSLEREVCFLIAHSMFHLLGYDHMTPEDEKIMLTKQETALQALSIER